jgi:Domain of unknown function (DUF5666)
MNKFLGVMLVSAAFGLSACGSKGNAPTAPSSGSGAGTLTAATITGSVRNGSSSATVGVAGTSMTTGLDGAGHFTLANVPTGDVQLHVTSGGANAMVPIAAVQAAQTIEVVVSVSGATASLDSEVRHGGGETELNGVVEALPPTTAASTFRAAGKTVATNASTIFVNSGVTRTFADLTLGARVEVKGTLAGDTLTATRVEIEGAIAPAPAPVPAPKPEAEVTGTISALSGTASSFQFNVGSLVVKGDSTTAIGGSDNGKSSVTAKSGDTGKSFADLKNGVVVEVKGVQQNGFVQASRIQIDGPDDEDNNGDADVQGTLGAVSGTCPAITSSVAGTKFTTSGSTRFDDACAAFASGDTVEVRGTRVSDGSIAATRLRERK